MTSSKSARRTRRERRARDTRPLPALRTASYDATTITFGGMSAPGLPDADITAAQSPAGHAHAGLPDILIGNALAVDPAWAPKFAILPCGHCGAEYGGTRPADQLHLHNPLATVKARAWEDGWRLDYDHTLTCPACQQTDAWKARQCRLELRKFEDDLCDRHDGPVDSWQDIRPADDPRGRCDCPPVKGTRPPGPDFPGVRNCTCYRCTCPGAVVAIDVMLRSEDYLGSGSGRHRAVTR